VKIISPEFKPWQVIPKKYADILYDINRIKSITKDGNTLASHMSARPDVKIAYVMSWNNSIHIRLMSKVEDILVVDISNDFTTYVDYGC
jgi:hypothetical protein